MGGIDVMLEGLKIYFQLVSNGFVHAKEEEGVLYFSDAAIRDFVKQCANASGTEVLEGSDYIHLVASDNGSLFSTPYSQLKQKFGFENQEQFHVLCVIALVYLAEIDTDIVMRNQMDIEGTSYYKLIKDVENVLNEWSEKIENDTKFEEQWGINIWEVINVFSTRNLKDEKASKLLPSFKTKSAIVHMLMKFLEDNNLVRIYPTMGTFIVYPTEILYERMNLAYRDDTRFNSIRNLILKSQGSEL
ncbi:DUF6063 family protein [Evansella tamaricis]|uniref:Uncharacterized protein n=1 Tax=Evansella tamaricis TaxID=2069301 RepID=A0ABS6JAG4_9BACI|nr:DUF6063 family protein [Evansella tamaricis]MBU9710531.1 hypothetical protein [Evansella tamaricis]